ncbi:MAG TPA: hypothetical protein VGL53_11145 [Bryobacteraceae bacterium]|jgi:hypothetical protein
MTQGFFRAARRWAIGAAAVLAIAYAGFFGLMYWLMTQPPERFGAAMVTLGTPTFLLLPFESMWFRARAGTVHVGDPAPDFQLPALDRKSSVTLASLRGVKPVALIFGSYT